MKIIYETYLLRFFSKVKMDNNAYTHICTSNGANARSLVARCDMKHIFITKRNAAVIMHTNCLDKRESERSFRNS